MPESERDSAERSLKRLLIVSREFPPSRVIAGQRIGAFAKFLPENGITVHVLTKEVSENNSKPRTVALKQLLPECTDPGSEISYIPGAADEERFVQRVSRRLNNRFSCSCSVP